ncbi:MAG TPA: hypothetical protein VH144_02115, partial [Candidatus Saccharimonadales bacterium]|nr:hypothetical protein [Candidatus Saccharimonadales bacterium]
SVQVENSTLEAYINIDELCFAQVAGKSGAIAKFQGKALGIDIPGAWMSESLNENMSERICVDTKKTSLVWSNGGKGVKVTIAPGGIVTDTAIDTIIDGQSDRGATMATSEALAIFWSVVSNDGLPATIDGARTQLRNLAQLQTAENFVASCGPTAWKQFAGKRSTVGLQNIIMKFNPAVQKVDVTLPSTPPSFHSETAYPALQALHAKDNQNKNVDFSFDGKNVGTCTVPANVPVTDKAHNVWVPNRG